MTDSTAAGRPLNPAEVYATAKALMQGLFEVMHLICETIPEASVRWLRDKRLAVSPDGESVIDQVTGEILPWAEATPGSRYLTVRSTEQVKAAAVAVAEQLVSQIPAVAAVLTPAALEEAQA